MYHHAHPHHYNYRRYNPQRPIWNDGQRTGARQSKANISGEEMEFEGSHMGVLSYILVAITSSDISITSIEIYIPHLHGYISIPIFLL